MPRKISGLQSGEGKTFGEKNMMMMMMNFIISTPYTILIACLAQGG